MTKNKPYAEECEIGCDHCSECYGILSGWSECACGVMWDAKHRPFDGVVRHHWEVVLENGDVASQHLTEESAREESERYPGSKVLAPTVTS